MPSVNETAVGTFSLSAIPASGMLVVGAADIWIGLASTPSTASASPTDAAVVQTSRSDGPSTSVSLRAWLTMMWSPLDQLGGQRGLDTVLRGGVEPDRLQRRVDVVGERVDDAVLAVDRDRDRLVHGQCCGAAADQSDERREHGAADDDPGVAPASGGLLAAAVGTGGSRCAGRSRWRRDSRERVGQRLGLDLGSGDGRDHRDRARHVVVDRQDPAGDLLRRDDGERPC